MAELTSRSFGTLPDGRTVTEYTLTRGALSVKILDLGATVADIIFTRADGKAISLARGYDSLESYLGADGYLGAVVGRVGNRIAGGRFRLDGKTYTLYKNDGENHLHGGRCGFDKKLWRAEPMCDDTPELTLSCISPDGDEGYPGDLMVSVRYSITDRCGLRLDYTAFTNAPTPINLTNHTYFNLNGDGDILSHTLMIRADRYLPTDEGLIPTGMLKSVAATPFDFRESKTIGADLDMSDRDLGIARGYDHCMLFTRAEDTERETRIRLCGDQSGVVMDVFTDRPGVQLYTGNFLGNVKYPFRGGEEQQKRAALCLETEAAPDAVNRPHLNSISNTVLRPGDVFKSFTEYVFSQTT